MKHAYGPYFDLVRRRGMKYVTLTNLGLGIMQRARFLRFLAVSCALKTEEDVVPRGN